MREEGWGREGREVWRQEEEEEEGMVEWTEAAGRTLVQEVVVWVDMAGPEGGKKAGMVERGEKMEGWRQ